MIADLRPYMEYKESGLPWLGQVPEHWETRRLKQITRLAYGDSLPRTGRTEGMVPVFGSNGRVGWHSDSNTLAPCIIVGRKGSFGKINFCTESAFVIDTAFFIDRRSSKADIRWLYYTLGWIKLDGVSKDSAIPGLDREDAYQQVAALPPPVEQVAIVRFLDWANGRLDRAIRAKRKVIALLNEQKQAIIHRAVTRGLDSSVPLKPSGIPWLGDIPQHWETVPNRSYLKLRKRPVGERSREFVLLSLTLRGIVARDMENPTGKWPASFDTYQEVNPGDLVFCLFDIDETPRFVGLSTLRGMITGAYTVFACKNSEIAEWAYQFYLAMDFDKRLKPAYTGLRKVIQKSTFLGLKTPLPPTEERRAILGLIKSSTSGIVATISRLDREIELLREYRTRLVADVVTGKLDVREAAALLPDEAPPDTIEKETGLDDEINPADEEAHE